MIFNATGPAYVLGKGVLPSLRAINSRADMFPIQTIEHEMGRKVRLCPPPSGGWRAKAKRFILGRYPG